MRKPHLIPIIFILSSFLTFLPRPSTTAEVAPVPTPVPQAQQTPAAPSQQQVRAPQAPQPLQSGQMTSAQVQQALQSGQVTPAQVQLGLEALQSGVVSPEQLQQFMGKAQQGTLTPAEIETGKQLLERQKIQGAPSLYERAQPQPLTSTATPAEDLFHQKANAEQEAAQQSFFARVFGPGFAKLKLFGSDLFTGAPETFSPIKDVPVSNEYIVGPGDAINVLMWGRIEASYFLEVDNEGVINFPKIGPLTVAGLTFQEVKDLITSKAEAITGVNVSVSMGRLRTMQVFVLGEVLHPGVQTVSSLATAVNGLLVAGGPTLQGSLRHVEVKRQGRAVSVIDLYDFLLRGDTSGDQRLMPADVIFVPRAQTLVAISGNVKNPAVYELKPEAQTLQMALALAGGLSPRAFNQRIQIQRSAAHRFEIIVDIPYAELAGHEQVRLQDGDSINVFSVLPVATNAVYLYGNVLRPGPYAYKEGMTLLDLVPTVNSLQVDTSFEYALIKRYHLQDMSAELIPFNLGQLLVAKKPEHNLALQPLDEVYIFKKQEVETRPAVEISGEVRNPGRYEIDVMTVKDLIFRAGGFTRDALMDLGHLYRTDPRSKEVTLHVFNVGKALLEDQANNLRLQDHDRVVIHSIREYIGNYTVTAKGEFNKPDKYPYAGNMTVKDLILVAGNVKRSAFMDEGEIVRFNIVEGKTVQTSVEPFNVRRALEGDAKHDLRLQPWDIVTVKQIPDWGENREVTVSGEVMFPGAYSIRKGERLSSVLERAGGFTERAYFRGAVFTRESVRVQQQKRIDDMVERLTREAVQIGASEIAGAMSAEDVKEQQALASAQRSLIERLKNAKAAGRVVIKLVPGPAFAESEYNLALEASDTISIPARPDTVAVAGEVYNPSSLIFNSSKPQLEHYLGQTGGPTKYANPKDMFVIRADGTVDSKSGAGFGGPWLSGFENSPLYPGDTLVVPPRLMFTRLKTEIKDITSIIYEMAVSAGIIINQVFD